MPRAKHQKKNKKKLSEAAGVLSNFNVVDFTWNLGFLEPMLIQGQRQREERGLARACLSALKSASSELFLSKDASPNALIKAARNATLLEDLSTAVRSKSVGKSLTNRS